MADQTPRTTRAAAVIAGAHVLAALLLWGLSLSTLDPDSGGLEGVFLLAIGIGLILLSAWVMVVVIGLWRDRSWAHSAALLTFLLVAAGSTIAFIDTAGRLRGPSLPYGAPPRHLIAPAALLIGSVAVVVLLLLSLGRRRGQ